MERILRLWETSGNDGKCIITLPENSNFKSVQPCDLRGTITGKTNTNQRMAHLELI